MSHPSEAAAEPPQLQPGADHAPRNGLGVAALLLGLFGAPLALIPFIGIIGIILGVVALVLGLVGYDRARDGSATNGGMASIGAGLGVIAIGLGVWGLIVLNEGYDNLKGTASERTAEQRAESAARVER